MNNTCTDCDAKDREITALRKANSRTVEVLKDIIEIQFNFEHSAELRAEMMAGLAGRILKETAFTKENPNDARSGATT